MGVSIPARFISAEFPPQQIEDALITATDKNVSAKASFMD